MPWCQNLLRNLFNMFLFELSSVNHCRASLTGFLIPLHHFEHQYFQAFQVGGTGAVRAVPEVRRRGVRPEIGRCPVSPTGLRNGDHAGVDRSSGRIGSGIKPWQQKDCVRGATGMRLRLLPGLLAGK